LATSREAFSSTKMTPPSSTVHQQSPSQDTLNHTLEETWWS
jgi:hypothetical protein